MSNIKICAICFCLSGSMLPEILSAFSKQFLEYQDFDNGIIEKALLDKENSSTQIVKIKKKK